MMLSTLNTLNGKGKGLSRITTRAREVKAPAYVWDIQHYEDRINARSVEMAYLTDLTRVISADDIAGMKETTEKLLFDLDNLEFTEPVSNETTACVRCSLEEIIAFVEDN